MIVASARAYLDALNRMIDSQVAADPDPNPNPNPNPKPNPNPNPNANPNSTLTLTLTLTARSTRRTRAQARACKAAHVQPDRVRQGCSDADTSSFTTEAD